MKTMLKSIPAIPEVLPEGDGVVITENESVTDNVVHSSELYYQTLCNVYVNNLNDTCVNNCIPCQQDHNDPMIESKQCQHTNSRVYS